MRRNRVLLVLLLPGMMVPGPVARGQGLDAALPGDIPGFQTAPGLARIIARQPSAQPLGFALQSLRIDPSISLTPGYDSAPGPGLAGSATLGVAPQLRLIDPIIGVAGIIRFDTLRFARTPRQNTTDLTAALGWRVQAGPDRLDLGVARAVLQEDALGLAPSGGIGGGIGRNTLPYRVQVRAARANWRHRMGMMTLAGGLGVSQSHLGSTRLSPGFRTETALHGQVRAITTRHAPLRFVVQLDGRRTDYAGVLAGAPYGATNAMSLAAGLSTPRTAIVTLRALAGVARVRVAGLSHSGGAVPVFVLAVGWMPDRLSAVGLSIDRTDTGDAGLSLPGHPIDQAGLAAALGFDRHWVLDARLQGTRAAVPGGMAREVALQAGLQWRIGRMVTLAPEVTENWRQNVPGLAPRAFRAVLAMRLAR